MTGVALILTAGGSHLYPGAQGSVRGRAADGSCLVEFADGSAAFGRLTGGEGKVLALDAYTTARGTEIAEKRWAIGLSGQAPERRFRILARVQSPSG